MTTFSCKYCKTNTQQHQTIKEQVKQIVSHSKLIPIVMNKQQESFDSFIPLFKKYKQMNFLDFIAIERKANQRQEFSNISGHFEEYMKQELSENHELHCEHQNHIKHCCTICKMDLYQRFLHLYFS